MRSGSCGWAVLRVVHERQFDAIRGRCGDGCACRICGGRVDRGLCGRRGGRDMAVGAARGWAPARLAAADGRAAGAGCGERWTIARDGDQPDDGGGDGRGEHHLPARWRGERRRHLYDRHAGEMRATADGSADGQRAALGVAALCFAVDGAGRGRMRRGRRLWRGGNGGRVAGGRRGRVAHRLCARDRRPHAP